jgi:CRP-like cAMP-binding protein
MEMTLIDLEYEDFVKRIKEMPPEIARDLVEALEDRLRGIEAAVVAARQRGDKGAETRLLMTLAWNARKLAALKAVLAEARLRDMRWGES